MSEKFVLIELSNAYAFFEIAEAVENDNRRPTALLQSYHQTGGGIRLPCLVNFFNS
jgi:hypothetical protein